MGDLGVSNDVADQVHATRAGAMAAGAGVGMHELGDFLGAGLRRYLDDRHTCSGLKELIAPLYEVLDALRDGVLKPRCRAQPVGIHWNLCCLVLQRCRSK